MALEQAGRDFLLSLRQSIEAVLRETLCDSVAEALTPGRHGRHPACVWRTRTPLTT